MAQLARTPHALQRLFSLVDMAPLPLDAAVAQGLRAWTERRSGRLAPKATEMMEDETATVLEHSLEALPTPDRRDFALSCVGQEFRQAMGLEAGQGRLAAATNRRLAARLRRLFQLVEAGSEPVLVRFSDRGDHTGRANYEIVAAPIFSGSRKGVFCTMGRHLVAQPAAQHRQGGYEARLPS